MTPMEPTYPLPEKQYKRYAIFWSVVMVGALLGALALGDIGKHFPDTDEEFRGIDSKILLEKTINKLFKKIRSNIR